MSRVHGPLALGVITFLAATSAAAYSNGHFGHTGRTASCLACHGSQQYGGGTLTISGLGDTINCWVDAEEGDPDANADGLKLLSLPTLGFATTVDVTVAITDPSGGDQLQCPEYSCCGVPQDPNDTPPADAYCNNPDGFRVDEVLHAQGECVNYLNDCDIDDDGTDDPVVGFDIEAVNGGAFDITGVDGVKFRTNAGEDVVTEVSHSQTAAFNGADVSYSLSYTTPAEADYTDAIQFWLGVNVANGNGKADGLDLNSNYQATVALGDRVPSFCATCDDGSLPDENGTCGGCGCSAQQESGSFGTMAAAVLGFGLALYVRRRRR